MKPITYLFLVPLYINWAWKKLNKKERRELSFNTFTAALCTLAVTLALFATWNIFTTISLIAIPFNLICVIHSLYIPYKRNKNEKLNGKI